MFAQIKGVIDLIRSGVSDFGTFKSNKERKEAVLDLLHVYFMLKDCVEDGENLFSEAQPNPVEMISAMDAETALSTMERWDKLIYKQGRRLHSLQGAIFGQDHLAIINPTLQDKISEVIGNKMDRAVSLHGIGSALFFKNMFPIADTNKEKARYISLMAGEEGDSLNMSRIREEIQSLKEALNQYREVVERLLSDKEILELSKRARLETKIV